jgi:ribosomal protein L11 methyltransferase
MHYILKFSKFLYPLSLFNNYISLTFHVKEEEQQQILIAWLNELGFEGFEELPDRVVAFIPEPQYNEALLKQAFSNSAFTFQKEIIKQKNWNEEWEKNFQPVEIGNEVVIAAGFHQNLPDYPYKIIIDPKMSFGTGHHETTAMMIQFMLDHKQDFVNRSVLDFGSGTGILTVMASKLGASAILAVDHEEWAYHNSVENFVTNQVTNAVAILGEEKAFAGRKFDIILANINRHIILNNFSVISQSLNREGTLYCSGFLLSDGKDIMEQAAKVNLENTGEKSNGNWLAFSFKKTADN